MTSYFFRILISLPPEEIDAAAVAHLLTSHVAAFLSKAQPESAQSAHEFTKDVDTSLNGMCFSLLPFKTTMLPGFSRDARSVVEVQLLNTKNAEKSGPFLKRRYAAKIESDSRNQLSLIKRDSESPSHKIATKSCIFWRQTTTDISYFS